MSNGWVRYSLVWITLFPLFLWPAIYNNGPIWFPDSMSYLGGPDNAFKTFFGHDSAKIAANDAIVKDFAGPITDSQGTRYAGRSIYFGSVMFALTEFFGLWGNITFQAGIFLTILLAATAPFMRASVAGSLFVGFVVGAFTAAPFYTSYMMPDFLAGVTIIAAIRLLGIPLDQSGLPRFLWWAVLLFSVTAHTSHLLLAAGILIAAPLIFAIARVRWIWNNAALVLATIVIAICAEVVFSNVVKQTFGNAPLRPPFLAARLIDDGPGYLFLKETCPESGFELCKYVDRLPVYSDDFLWSRDEDSAVYANATRTSQQRISQEQFALTLAVVARYPGQQFRESMKRFWEQLSLFGLSEFSYSDGLRSTLEQVYSGTSLEAIRDTKFYQGTFPVHRANNLANIFVVLSIIHLAFAIVWRNRRAQHKDDEMTRMFVVFTVMVVIGVIGNAAITGILSAPHARYQSRVIWLIPMISSILVWRNAIIPVFIKKTQRQIT